MALPKYDPAKHLVYLNGKRITEWGEGDPIKTSPIRDKGVLKQGFGRSAVASRIETPGEELTLNIMPGTDDSAYASGLISADVDIEFEMQVVATGEAWIYSEGVYKTHEEFTRAGEKPSDDGYTYLFNLTEHKMGSI